VCLRGVCVGDGPPGPLRPGASLDSRRAFGCSGQRRVLRTASVAPLPGVWVPRVHGVCYHNEIAALVKRSLGPTPGSVEARRGPVLDAFRRIRRVASRYSESRWDYLETAQSYTGALRRRYLEAERSLREDGPLGSSDYLLRAFLKAEKRHLQNVAKPRMIFPRSPRYNLHLASWLKPFEHWLWGNLRRSAFNGVGNSRVVAKGLSPRQRAALIVRKFSEMPDCVVMEVDGRAFEAHLDVWQLLQEHCVYASAYPGDGGLRKCLNKQLRNFGVTGCGLRFSRDGGRASGDFNTGMGNSIVMLAVVAGAMSLLGEQRWDTLVDGDNALLFLPSCAMRRVVQGFAAAALEVSGHEMVLERPVSVVEEVRFGQSGPVWVEGGWQMVRDWRKIVSHGTSSHAHLHEPRFALEWIRGVALCEASLAHGVPILWSWANRLLSLTESVTTVRWDAHRDYSVLGVCFAKVGARAREPDLVSRQSFSRAFGVTPDEQVQLEGLMSAVEVFVAPSPAVEWDDPVYGDWFE